MLYDKDIREPLAFYLEELYGKNRILEEQVMGQSRADLVMVVHDALYGIEIKSDADSYARLDRQVKDYNLYYDYDLVVVGTRHAAHIKEHVPEWWGIITVEQVGEQVDFYMLREPSFSDSRVTSFRFGRNRRRVLLLAWLTLLPLIGPLPVSSQTRDMVCSFVSAVRAGGPSQCERAPRGSARNSVRGWLPHGGPVVKPCQVIP